MKIFGLEFKYNGFDVIHKGILDIVNLWAQINNKAPIASPTFTGIVTAPVFSGVINGDSTLAIGAYSSSEGVYTMSGNGVVYNITAFNNTSKTITLNSVTGLVIGNELIITTDGSIPLRNNVILSITGLVVTLTTTITLSSSNYFAIKITGSSATHTEGYGGIATGPFAHSEGGTTLALGLSSHSEGWLTIASGDYSHSEGSQSYAKTDYAHVGGKYCLAYCGNLYNITAINDASKTITLDTVTGLVVGDKIDIKIKDSVPLSDICITNISALVVTLSTMATLTTNHTHAIKKRATILPTHAEGFGSTATGSTSYAIGFGNLASGDYSNVSGVYNIGKYGQTVIGQCATISPASDITYIATNEAFIIGNGTSASSRGNAFKILYNGSTYSDGAYASTGADYAEFFQWIDRNRHNEDRVGYLVTLDGEEIRKATSKDNFILGAVSATPSVVGDSYESWQGKYITDMFGRIQYHEIIVPEKMVDDVMIPERVEIQPVYNPNWNPSEEYISREHRPEWSWIGLVGKLIVWDDGTCKINSYCRPNDDGVATASDTGYRVMSRISENVIRILIQKV